VKYLVFEDDKAAKFHNSKVWGNNEFSNMDDAIAYVHKWLGDHSPGIDKLQSHFATNQKYEFYPSIFMEIKTRKDKE
jgi:hypothetical protein